MSDKDLFLTLKDKLLEFDPVSWSQKYLTLDGKPYRIQGNGYRPFADLVRLIGVKSLERDSKPIIISKSRQVGLTTTTSVLEMYFLGSGLFGKNGKPPIRIIHAFPTLEIAAAYSKTKFNAMVSSSIPVPGSDSKRNSKTYMQSLLDGSSDFNNSMTFKQFAGGNHVFIESVGVDGDRIRGKQLSLDTELPTSNGFIKLSDLKEGDELFDEKGNICKVTKLHPINYSPEAFKLTFDDGTEVEACADHLWLTYTKANRVSARIKNPSKPTVKNTLYIFNSLKTNNLKENNHSIPNTLPLNYPEKELPIDPYLLGLWLGDASSCGLAVESTDAEILKSCKYRIEGLTTKLNQNNLLNNKHIPEIYLKSSYEQRLSLLQGLMDTNGRIDKTGRLEFCSVIPELAKNAHELIKSLGIKCSLIKNENCLYNKICKYRYRLNFITILPVFRLDIKLKRIKKHNRAIFHSTHRFISKVERIESKPMRCITVDSPSHLFLITRSFIPTHNTADVLFFDECFPYNQKIETSIGPIRIGSLYNRFKKEKPLPLIKTFNEVTEKFEFKKILNAWQRSERDLIQINYKNRRTRCTPNHRFLTNNGWVAAENLTNESLLKSYNGSNKFMFNKINNIKYTNKKEKVYDLEIEDNHNFILCPSGSSKNVGGPIVHNCQDMSDVAISNTTKTALKAQYGALGGGVQVYFGTPKMRGSAFHHMWQASSQQYYYLGCEQCKDYFALYTPGSDDWEKIWIHGFIVKCTKCGHEQDKRSAAERGKWISTKDPNECQMIGFHINQLYMPDFTKEKMLSEKPGISPINSERSYQNEVLGEFFQGETSPITPDEIRIHCAEVGRKFRAKIDPGEEPLVVLGLDYGGRNDIEQIANPGKVKQAGKSFTTAVVLSVSGPNILSIDFATKFKRNDMEYKKGLIDQIMKTYSVDLAVGDIGYSEDFSNVMHQAYGDRYLVSRALGTKVNDNIKFNENAFPKEIQFQRDHFIMDIYEQLKKGQFKFPYGDYEKIAWLIQHCCNMEIKPTISRTGDPQIHYIKSGPNDGFMALLNAYLAYKFYITKGFTVKNPNLIKNVSEKKSEPLAILGRIKRKF
jgi:intein/homing endonuclease